MRLLLAWLLVWLSAPLSACYAHTHRISAASQVLTSTTVMDALGRTEYSRDGKGTCTKYLYDDAGRTTHTVAGLTQAQAQAIASPADIPAGAIVSFSEYDDLGRAIRQVNPSGLWKAMGYDSMGRLASVTQPIDADASHNQVTRFGYDEAGMKLWQQDAAQHSTRFGYDVAGRMLWRQMPGGQTERMGYNARGQVASKSDFRQMVTTMTYDERGRMLTQVPDARLGEPALSYGYPDEFTSVSTRGSGTNALSTIRRMDPDRGWLSSVQTPNGALGYSYDGASGQRTGVSELNASGQAVFTNGYSYDELGRLKQVATATMGTGSTPQVLASYGYDQNGNREAILRANGVASAYGYDALNRLRTLRHFKGALTLANYGYDVREDGKRRGVQEDLFNADLLPDGSQRATNRSVGFGYDGAGRLIGESGSDGRGIAYENSWQYDAAGNRVGETYRRATATAPGTLTSTTTIAAQFNANDWLLSQSSSTTNAGGTASTYGTTFGYDDNGSQTGQSTNGGAAQLNAWDFQRQLAGVSTQGTSAPHTRYATDAGGNRLSVTTGMGSASPKTSSYLTDPNTSYAQVLAQHDSDGEEARWVWEESLAPLTMTRGGRTFFYLTDGQDSVRQLTDESGKVTDSYHYDAWGNALAGGSGTTKNPFRYTGQQQDADGKYFLRARYYNSGTGRFLSHDPVTGDSQDPITLHRYLYAGNDGVNFSDPSGRDFSLSGTMASMGAANLVRNVTTQTYLGIYERAKDTLLFGPQVALNNLQKESVMMGALASAPIIGEMAASVLSKVSKTLKRLPLGAIRDVGAVLRRSPDDLLYAVFGAAKTSHPERVAEMRQALVEANVEIIEGASEFTLAYSPAMGSRRPQFIVTDDASIGAWEHEFQHFLDDAERGYPGWEHMLQPYRRIMIEAKAYAKEIALAVEAGRQDLAEQIEQQLFREIDRIQRPGL